MCRKVAISRLAGLGKASLIVQGPTTLGGIGDVKRVCPYRVYKVDIPLQSAVMRGVGLNQVTSKFPMYLLEEQVQHGMNSYQLTSKNPRNLPRLPAFV